MTTHIRLVLMIMIAMLGSSTWAESIDTNELLRSNDTTRLEVSLAGVQSRFESGLLTEYELRNAFRPFYKLDATSEKNLRSWAAGSPKSYAAHLALGIYYKRLGGDARGEKYISQTPQKNLDEMARYLQMAEKELRQSLTLTAKPYLSIFHLLWIAGHMGDRHSLEELLAMANKALPSNALVRDRYAVYLLPRWGGSYDELDLFIEATVRQGAPGDVVKQLRAIKYDDVGFVLEESGKHSEAKENFERALRLGGHVGGTFSVDFLSASRYYLCSRKTSQSYCQQHGELRVGKLSTVAPPISAEVDLFPGTLKTHSLGFLRVEQDVPGMRSAGSQGWAGVLNTHFWFDPLVMSPG